MIQLYDPVTKEVLLQDTTGYLSQMNSIEEGIFTKQECANLLAKIRYDHQSIRDGIYIRNKATDSSKASVVYYSGEKLYLLPEKAFYLPRKEDLETWKKELTIADEQCDALLTYMKENGYPYVAVEETIQSNLADQLNSLQSSPLLHTSYSK